MIKFLDGFIANMYLQVKRFWRARSRVIGSIVQPLFWMIFFGIGFTNSVSFRGTGLVYMDYLIPGVIVMTIFSASFFSGVSVIWDREFGFLKLVLVSPASRKASIFGRLMGDALIALTQGIVISIVAYFIDPNLNYLSVPIILVIALLVAISTSSLGIIIASRLSSMEGFGLIMNLIMMPFIFGSGVFFPIEAMPLWMQIIAIVNPLTYGADAARWLMLGVSTIGIVYDLLVLILISIILVSIAMITFERMAVG